MRLIDADALMKECHEMMQAEYANGNYSTHNGIAIAMGFISATPTVDAVPVVRCKYCENGAKMDKE